MVETKGRNMSESIFNAEKNYYVFKYVVDAVTGEPTEYESDIVAFVKATDPWEACEKAGFDDANAYGANRIEDLGKIEKAISDERKHLTKISKQLKEMTDEQEAEKQKFIKERKCPNGCPEQMDSQFRCKNCGYGHECEDLIKDIDKMIKQEKKAGNDTSELESIRKSLQSEVDRQDGEAKE